MADTTAAQVLSATTAGEAGTPPGIPALAPREDFPILAREVHGKPLVFLDSAASAQKPVQVLAAMDQFARTSYANCTQNGGLAVEIEMRL